MPRARSVLAGVIATGAAAAGVAALGRRRAATDRPVAVRSGAGSAPGAPAATRPASPGPGRPALTVASARAVARTGRWSETILGLLAVIITLLLGAAEEADRGDGVVEGRPDADGATPGGSEGGAD